MNKEIAKKRQYEFFKKIEGIIPQNTSLVNEIADILELSTDSAYRRMRMETFLNLEEIILLSNHFKIPFDTQTDIKSDIVTFSYTNMTPHIDSFFEYLTKLVEELEAINKSPQKEIIYASEDIPIFHHYQHPVLSSFKMFYWISAILSVPEYENLQFDANNIPLELAQLGKKAIDLYSNISTIEIWTENTIQSSVKQIEYFWESGKFKTLKDALDVVSALKEEIIFIQKQAEKGSKLIYPIADNQSFDNQNNYKLYFSDLEITNNCVFVKMGDVKLVYLGHFTFNSMSTFNLSYCNETEIWLNTLIRKSSLISGTAEKLRYKIFNKYLNQIETLEQKIKSI